jgi:hypothetical protein
VNIKGVCPDWLRISARLDGTAGNGSITAEFCCNLTQNAEGAVSISEQFPGGQVKRQSASLLQRHPASFITERAYGSSRYCFTN